MSALRFSWALIEQRKRNKPRFRNRLGSLAAIGLSWLAVLGAVLCWDGTFDKIINWAIMNEKAHLYSPSFGARAECNTNKAKGALGSHGTARTGALGHSRVLWATAQLGMH